MSDVEYTSLPVLEKPDQKDPFHKEMEPKWDKIRTVLAGTQAMRDAGEKFTPKFKKEDTETYKRRLQKTDLTNVLADSIENVVSKPFSEPIKFDVDNTLEEYKEWAEDVDRQGNDISTFAEDTFYQSVADGIGYLLVDSPSTGGAQLTVKEAKELNIRPYIVFIDGPSMIAFRRSLVNGAHVPTYIRYIVETTDFDDQSKAIEVKTVHEIQAASPGRSGFFRVYESRDKQDWEVIDEGDYHFDQVTVEPFNLGKKHERKADIVTPPFLDLAETNIAHWNSQSDQNNILEHSRFAMYVFKGMEPPKDAQGEPLEVEFGPATYFFIPPNGENQASMGVDAVTLKVDGLIQGWTDLDRKEASMKAMGLEPLTPKNAGALTASERIIEEKSTNSRLANWTIRFAKVLEKVFSYMGLWAGLKNASNVKIIINTEFGVTEKEINEIKFLQQMHSMGQLSLQTLLEEVQRKQVFDSEFDVNQELVRINEEHNVGGVSYEPPGTPPAKGDEDGGKGGVKLPPFKEAA